MLILTFTVFESLQIEGRELELRRLNEEIVLVLFQLLVEGTRDFFRSTIVDDPRVHLSPYSLIHRVNKEYVSHHLTDVLAIFEV